MDKTELIKQVDIFARREEEEGPVLQSVECRHYQNLTLPLVKALKDENTDIINQIEEWIRAEDVLKLIEIYDAVRMTERAGTLVAVTLFSDMHRLLDSKRGIHDIIFEMRLCVPPWEYETFDDEDEAQDEIYTRYYYGLVQKITDHVLEHGVEFIPDMTDYDDDTLAENMILPLMDAWLQKSTPQIEAKLKEVVWMSRHGDIEDMLRRKIEEHIKQEIEVPADIISRYKAGKIILDVSKEHFY